MNFLFGGADNPLEKENFQVKDLVKYHGNNPVAASNAIAQFNEKFGKEWASIDSFEHLMKNKGLNDLTDLAERLQGPYSRMSIIDAIKCYKDKQYAKKKHGLMGVSGTIFEDLKKIKAELEKADNDNEKVIESLGFVGSQDIEPSINNKHLHGEKWLKDVSEKISDKMNSFTSKLFDLDIWDFDGTINAYREAGELGSMSSQPDLSLTSSSRGSRRSRSRSRSRSQSSRRSRSRSRSRSEPRSRSGSQGSRRSRSRSRSRSRPRSGSRSRSGSQGSRRSRSVSSDDLPLGRQPNRPVARRLFD